MKIPPKFKVFAFFVLLFLTQAGFAFAQRGEPGQPLSRPLVLLLVLGINKEFNPRFLRRYADLHGVITGAISGYVRDVRSTDFPGPHEQY